MISPKELYFLSIASAEIGCLPPAVVAVTWAKIRGCCESGLLSAGELPSADYDID